MFERLFPQSARGGMYRSAERQGCDQGRIGLANKRDAPEAFARGGDGGERRGLARRGRALIKPEDHCDANGIEARFRLLEGAGAGGVRQRLCDARAFPMLRHHDHASFRKRRPRWL